MAWWWNLIILAASFVIVLLVSGLVSILYEKRGCIEEEHDFVALTINDITILAEYGLGFAVALVLSVVLKWTVLKWVLFVGTAGIAIILVLPALLGFVVRFFSAKNLINPLFWLQVISSLVAAGCLTWMSLYILLHSILGVL